MAVRKVFCALVAAAPAGVLGAAVHDRDRGLDVDFRSRFSFFAARNKIKKDKYLKLNRNSSGLVAAGAEGAPGADAGAGPIDPADVCTDWEAGCYDEEILKTLYLGAARGFGIQHVMQDATECASKSPAFVIDDGKGKPNSEDDPHFFGKMMWEGVGKLDEGFFYLHYYMRDLYIRDGMKWVMVGMERRLPDFLKACVGAGQAAKGKGASDAEVAAMATAVQRCGTCGAEPNFSDYTVDVGERDADGKWLKPQHVYLFEQDGSHDFYLLLQKLDAEFQRQPLAAPRDWALLGELLGRALAMSKGPAPAPASSVEPVPAVYV